MVFPWSTATHWLQASAEQDLPEKVCTVCREYEGQLKMRYTVQSMRPVEFIAESKRMIDQLAKLRVKAEAV